ncbi:MAG: glutamate formimidoyltransferase [Chloroflexota bacterium]|nr:glutamate formimidoyltransferase [Chloroflexota bacterium]
MALQLVECVANFSQGRDQTSIQAIAAAAGSSGAVVLDIHSDPDHHRSVVTFVGEPHAVLEGAYQAVRTAVERLDLSRHEGVHPRIGVADVVPFVPVSGASMEDCVRLAKSFAERAGRELGLPVYLYGHAALRAEMHNLADVRASHQRALASRGRLSVDAGPDLPHPTAGAVAVGARAPLVALNCNLDRPDIDAARAVARRVRERGGGRRGVKALGLWLAHASTAQVSMNITDVDASPPHTVVAKVEELAGELGAHIAASELVGLVPLDSVLRAAAEAMKLPDLAPRQVLELAALERIRKMTLDEFIDDLASSSPAPGGGAASALVGCLAAALSSMVSNLTIGRPRYADVDLELRDAPAHSEQLRARLRHLMDDDEQAYSELMNRYRLPRETEEQVAHRQAAIEAGLRAAAEVPLSIARTCLELLETVATVADKGNANAVSDAGAAAILAQAAARASLLNVRTNAGLMKDRAAAANYVRQMEEVERTVNAAADAALLAAVGRIRS